MERWKEFNEMQIICRGIKINHIPRVANLARFQAIFLHRNLAYSGNCSGKAKYST